MNAETLKQFQQAWADKDMQKLAACMTDDVVYCASVGTDLGETWRGKRDVLAGIAKMIAYDDADAEIGDLHIAGDYIFNTWIYRAKTTGKTTAKGCDIFRFKNGLIVHKDAYRKVTL
ncbi:MAG: nuclear transport factor 2 family protein [Robiginitomaculum sp.]|nr:nuclear transport factor 2 family protein [Robiginitomaculum sp.]